MDTTGPETDPRIAKERLEKMQASQAYGAIIGGQIGTNGLYDEPCRASLRERVDSQLHRARREKIKAERLEELQYLLEKYPDIARILDLIEEVRG